MSYVSSSHVNAVGLGSSKISKDYTMMKYGMIYWFVSLTNRSPQLQLLNAVSSTWTGMDIISQEAESVVPAGCTTDRI